MLKKVEPVKGYIIRLECIETGDVVELTCNTGPELEMILTDIKRLKNVEITFPKLGGVIAKNPVPYVPGTKPNTGVVHNVLNYTKGCVCFSCKRISEEQDKKKEEGYTEPSCDDITELDKLFDELDEQDQVENKDALQQIVDDIVVEKSKMREGPQKGPVEEMAWNIEQGAWLPVEKPKATYHSEICSCKDCDVNYNAALMKHPTSQFKSVPHSKFCSCFKCEDAKTDEQIRNMFP